MYKWCFKLLTIMLIFSSSNLYAQQKTVSDTVNSSKNTYKVVVPWLTTKSFFKTANSYFLPVTITSLPPSNYYTSNVGFFCKQELLLEKVSKIPFRFRLGSLSNCNFLEGK
jgi:hypothetical protein